MTLAKNISAGFDKAFKFAVWGAIGGAIGNLVSEPFPIIQSTLVSLPEAIVHTSLWFGLIGAGIAVALLVASSQYLKRGLQVGQAFKGGVLLGFVAGAVAGGIIQYTYTSIGPTEVLRVICWGIAGGLLGLGLSFRIPNLGRWRGLGGGLFGGLLGGSLFVILVVVSNLPDIIGRLTGTAAIGFCIGLMIVIIEVAFRQAWLEVRYGSREVRTVSLGSQPITIGSNASTCTIFAHHAPPVALRYQITQGQILCEDIPSGMTRKLQPEDEQTVGDITIIVRAANSSLPATNSPPKISHQSSSQFFLHIKRRDIPLTDGTYLQAQEIPGLEPQTAGSAVAEVSRNPQDPTILGLKNCSHQVWTATLTSGEQKQIKSGRTVKLTAGTKINFGSVVGEIRV